MPFGKVQFNELIQATVACIPNLTWNEIEIAMSSLFNEFIKYFFNSLTSINFSLIALVAGCRRSFDGAQKWGKLRKFLKLLFIIHKSFFSTWSKKGQAKSMSRLNLTLRPQAKALTKFKLLYNQTNNLTCALVEIEIMKICIWTVSFRHSKHSINWARCALNSRQRRRSRRVCSREET